ncbi:Leo1-like protein-domain-containing protein [Crepidotus variabilis]|uniref:Leo1-like protein-domain-containing protein n=1 Tax=Crepidotus variabilis TaxID=179855 RepID=A0A9P6EMB2_9AGAR|nr:Leo1-like protein-domain-containing protein [Crepidotus variabilis]
MSSLSGALDDYSQQSARESSEDVEMNPAPGNQEDEDGSDSGQHHGGAEEDEEMDDLFGNDVGVEQAGHNRAPASPTTSGPDSERLTSPERERRRALEYEEDDAPPEIAVEVKEAEVKFPNLPVPKSSDGDSWVVRMPNFVNVDTKPYHTDTYIGPEQEDEDLQGQSAKDRSSAIKLRVENTLRWKWAKDELGQDKRESNARVIRWSDGTLSLRLGKEYFDITQSIDSSAGVSRSTLGGSQTQSQLIPQSRSQPTHKSEGLTYLFAQHKRSQVLQSEALITGYMTLRPTGMQSETHRMLVRAVGQKHNKKAKLRMVAEPTVDPEREKMEAMKASQRKTKTTRRSALAGLGDDDEALGMGGKKRRGGRAMDRGDIYTDDEEEQGMYAGDDFDDDDDGFGGSSRKQKRKGGDDKERGGDYQADDFVVPDESDDEDAGGHGRASGSRSKKRARDASAEEDDLERMEAKLEKQAAAERKSPKKPKKKKKSVDDDDNEGDAEATDEDVAAMDLESEEEDEYRVRKVTGKRTIAIEEDDDDE